MLTPLYDAFEKHCLTGDMDKAAEFYHIDGVMVEKGKSVAYGKAREFVLFGPHNYKLTLTNMK